MRGLLIPWLPTPKGNSDYKGSRPDDQFRCRPQTNKRIGHIFNGAETYGTLLLLRFDRYPEACSPEWNSALVVLVSWLYVSFSSRLDVRTQAPRILVRAVLHHHRRHHQPQSAVSRNFLQHSHWARTWFRILVLKQAAPVGICPPVTRLTQPRGIPAGAHCDLRVAPVAQQWLRPTSQEGRALREPTLYRDGSKLAREAIFKCSCRCTMTRQVVLSWLLPA